MDTKVLKTSNRRRTWLLFGIIAVTIVFIYVFNRRWAPSNSLGVVHFWLEKHPLSSPNSSATDVGQKDEPLAVAVAWDRYAIDTSNLSRERAGHLINTLVAAGKLDFHWVARQPVDEEWLSPIEKEILQDQPVQSLDTVAVPGKSRLVIVSPVRNNNTVKVGDKVTVRVDLKDTKGWQVRNGGHFVRVWMVQKDGGPRRSLAVDVTDLRNGSYLASLPVLWRGKIQVKAALVRTREVRRVLLLIKNLMKMTSQNMASFVNGTTEQVTLCSFVPVVPGFPKVCNLTADNSGLPWYCGKPNRSGLTCDHWAWSSNTGFPGRYPVSETDNLLLKQCYNGSIANQMGLLARQIINLTSVGGQMPTHSSCKPLRPLDTWTDQSPRGYWEDFQWKPLTGCPLPDNASGLHLAKCYRNTHMLFFGDSNARNMMMAHVLRGLNCTRRPDPRQWYHPNMLHVPLFFHCRPSNTSWAWYPHAYPFFTGHSKWSDVRVKHAPAVILDKIPNVGKYVVFIHLYIHFSPVHLSIFVLHVRVNARAVRNLLARNPHVKVFIRGPHAVTGNSYELSSDAFSEQVLRVLNHEFRDLRDRVVLLNTWDMTVANENFGIHPHASVCRALVRMTFAFVCPNLK